MDKQMTETQIRPVKTDINQLKHEKEELNLRLLNVANQVHDSNNLITTVLLLSHLNKRLIDKNDIGGVEKNLGVIETNLKSVQSIQKNALNYLGSSKNPTDFKKLDLTQVVPDALNTIAIGMGNDIEISSSVDGITEYIIDKNALFNHIILNIIKNAKEALSGKPGKIDVQFLSVKRYHDIYGEEAKFNGKPNDDLVVVVKDNAGGMPEDIARQLFEQAITTKDTGHGIGTKSIKRCTEEWLEGELSLENKVGEGVTYHLWIPNGVLRTD